MVLILRSFTKRFHITLNKTKYNQNQLNKTKEIKNNQKIQLYAICMLSLINWIKSEVTGSGKECMNGLSKYLKVCCLFPLFFVSSYLMILFYFLIFSIPFVLVTIK